MGHQLGEFVEFLLSAELEQEVDIARHEGSPRRFMFDLLDERWIATEEQSRVGHPWGLRLEPSDEVLACGLSAIVGANLIKQYTIISAK